MTDYTNKKKSNCKNQSKVEYC